MKTEQTGRTQPQTCAHCGVQAVEPVAGLLRTSMLVYCCAGCRDEHLAALALVSATCSAPGCDLDAAADVPFCDEHLDPSVLSGGPGHRARSRAA